MCQCSARADGAVRTCVCVLITASVVLPTSASCTGAKHAFCTAPLPSPHSRSAPCCLSSPVLPPTFCAPALLVRAPHSSRHKLTARASISRATCAEHLLQPCCMSHRAWEALVPTRWGGRSSLYTLLKPKLKQIQLGWEYSTNMCAVHSYLPLRWVSQSLAARTCLK